MKIKIITNAITAILALTGGTADAQQKEIMGSINGMEKCYGIAKAGKNDCSTKNHMCAGEAKKNNDKSEWLNVPNGLCQKIAGGNTNTQDA